MDGVAGDMRGKAVRIILLLASVLFVVGVPVLLVSSNLRAAVNEVRLYEYGFNKYDVDMAVGLSQEELRDVAVQFIEYYNNDEEYLDIDLFNDREIEHMKDVKGLIRLDYRVQIGCAAYMGAFILAGFALARHRFWRLLAGRLVWGGFFTIAVLIVLGIWAAVDFESMFLVFHLASFSNDLWIMGPGDTLLPMFPEGFFNEATLFVAGATLVEALLLGGIGWGIVRFLRNRGGYSPANG